MVIPSSAPFTHSYESYTSHFHSDVDNFTGPYSEANGHPKAGDVNLEGRMATIETKMKNVKAELKNIETELKDFKTELKDFKTGIKVFHQGNLPQNRGPYNHLWGKARLTRSIEGVFNFYVRSFFGVSLTLHILYQFLTQ